ncbi:hypothetical protein SCLCIDRAFT_25378 [Scleroderma citrinum Foug A]|uniref:Uncharacterized protein n=1 Tax=Scleroderma citrinum Foug A TaxID=1036808 RepID=A0A0C2ZJW3_9AGAM|nr:hypothetical protein SCLCIDRAFT_25378 [Scleroderma citrinum Foug A]
MLAWVRKLFMPTHLACLEQTTAMSPRLELSPSPPAASFSMSIATVTLTIRIPTRPKTIGRLAVLRTSTAYLHGTNTLPSPALALIY